jgi:ferritin-like metal-binding protein YciE
MDGRAPPRRPSTKEPAYGRYVDSRDADAASHLIPQNTERAMRKLEDLFLHLLKDVYHAEKQATRAMPKMAKSVENEELRQALETHQEETLGQVERLEQVFELLGKKPRGQTCEAIQGLVEEAKEVMDEVEDPDVLDAGILASAQAIEHYEIARYGTLRAWAEELGMNDAAKLLQQTLDEEKKTDKLLTDIAVSRLNREAA